MSYEYQIARPISDNWPNGPFYFEESDAPYPVQYDIFHSKESYDSDDPEYFDFNNQQEIDRFYKIIDVVASSMHCLTIHRLAIEWIDLTKYVKVGIESPYIMYEDKIYRMKPKDHRFIRSFCKSNCN